MEMREELTEGIGSNYVKFGEKSNNLGFSILRKMLGNKKEETIQENSIANSRYIPVTIEKIEKETSPQEKKSAFKFLNSPKKATESLNSIQSANYFKNNETKSKIESIISECLKQYYLKENLTVNEKKDLFDRVQQCSKRELLEIIINKLEEKTSHINSMEANGLLEILKMLIESQEKEEYLKILGNYVNKLESLKSDKEISKEKVDQIIDKIMKKREDNVIGLGSKEENKINLIPNESVNSKYNTKKNPSCNLLEGEEENKSENSEIKADKFQLNLASPHKIKDKYGILDLDLNTDTSTVKGAKNNQHTLYERNFPSSMPTNLRNQNWDNIWSNEEEFFEKKEEISKNNKSPFDFVSEFI